MDIKTIHPTRILAEACSHCPEEVVCYLAPGETKLKAGVGFLSVGFDRGINITEVCSHGGFVMWANPCLI